MESFDVILSTETKPWDRRSVYDRLAEQYPGFVMLDFNAEARRARVVPADSADGRKAQDLARTLHDYELSTVSTARLENELWRRRVIHP